MKTREEIIAEELDGINRRARRNRKMVRSLLPCYEYKMYSCGTAFVAGVCANFEEYLEKTSHLPTKNQELYSYDLYWHHAQNDTVLIKHRIVIGVNKYLDTVDYAFIVAQPERTLELLTEGKCKIVERTTTPAEPQTYTALSCEDAE